jgi:hypothetical protein
MRNKDELLTKLASIPTGAAPPLDDVAWHVLINKADMAINTRWGLNSSDRTLAALLREYAMAERAYESAKVEIDQILRERDSLRMQLGRAKKKLERVAAEGQENEPDTDTE